MFGYNIVKDEAFQELTRSGSELLASKLQVVSLNHEIEELKSKLVVYKKTNPVPVDVNLGDPSPKDTEKRSAYVGVVAGLHKDILEPKIMQMISVAQFLLSTLESERDTDLILKGTIHAFWELHRWGESMLNEQLSTQIGDHPSKPAEEENN